MSGEALDVKKSYTYYKQSLALQKAIHKNESTKRQKEAKEPQNKNNKQRSKEKSEDLLPCLGLPTTLFGLCMSLISGGELCDFIFLFSCVFNSVFVLLRGQAWGSSTRLPTYSLSTKKPSKLKNFSRSMVGLLRPSLHSF
jgi:hypothetical protein